MKNDKYTMIYMVAGISSRFEGNIKPLIKVGPKGESLIECSINQALEAGFNEIIFIVNENTEKVFKDKFGYVLPSGEPVHYVLQYYDKKIRNKPWGTADALCCVKDIIKNPFVICNGDDLYGEDTFRILISHIEQVPSETATIGYKLKDVLPIQGKVNRAIFTLQNNYVKDIKEIFNITKSNTIDGEKLCSMNIYVLNPEILELLELSIKSMKKEFSEDKEVEFLIQHELTKLIKKHKIKMEIYPTKDKWFGITNPGDEIEIRQKLKHKIQSNL